MVSSRSRKAIWAGIFCLVAITANVLASEKQKQEAQSIYVAIEPALVTNYGGPGRLRYMSVEVSLRVSGIDGTLCATLI